MSNEYIVVNTKKDNKAIWSTIASTYTPSAGEVCIMVPTVNSLDEYKDDFKKATVGIKIGDGETVFKDLPLLTDVSSIRPDWDETDTSSPNYIWHKPITNSSLILSSEVMDLVLDDATLTNIVKNPKIKTFHYDEYYWVKDLSGDDLFTHPYDLLTEEDDTWGHYDIKYNVAEINHEPRYFYRSNILTKTEFYKYSETDEGYEYRVETLLRDIIMTTYDTYVVYQNLFKDYNNSSEVSNRTTIMVSKIADYLGAHNSKIEHQTLYDIINEVFDNSDDSSLKLQFSGHIYEKMNSTENKNEIEKRINENSKIYYEINNEVIIDMETKALYIRKLRLDHFFETAHGVQEISEIIYGTQDNPITQLQLPFKINESILANDLFQIEIVAKDDVREIDVIEGNPIDSFVYPFEYEVDENTIAEVEEAIILNDNSYLSKIEGLDPTSEEYINLTNSYNEMDTYLNDLIYNLKYGVIEQTNMRVKYDNEIIYQDYSMSNENIVFPITKLSFPEKFVQDFLETDIYNIYLFPREYEWDIEYTNLSPSNSLEYIDFREDLDISEHINNTYITVKYENTDLGTDELTHKVDYYIDKEYNRIVLLEPIISNCTIHFNIEYLKTELTDSEYTREIIFDETTGEITAINLILNTPINKEMTVSFKKNGKEYILQYYDSESYGYYTIEENNTEKIIKLQEAINGNAKIILTKNYNVNFNVSKDNLNMETGIITLNNPIYSTANVYYKKNSDAGGYLEIVFHYRLRELNSRFLSNLKPDWNADADDNNHIYNRPLWLTSVNGVEQIVMESGTLEDGIYSNGQSHYYEFFKRMFEEILGFLDLDEDIASLSQRVANLEDLVKEHEYWFKDWTVEGFEEYGSGILEIITNILKAIKDLYAKLNAKTEIYIGVSEPPVDDGQKYKLWVNINSENGNGLLYYKLNADWIPISALWTTSKEEDAL